MRKGPFASSSVLGPATATDVTTSTSVAESPPCSVPAMFRSSPRGTKDTVQRPGRPSTSSSCKRKQHQR